MLEYSKNLIQGGKFMAVCPKCGKKFGMFELSPKCQKCGTNLLYYKIEERLEVDATNAEIEHTKMQQRLDRAKASYLGSVWTIIRMVIIVLAVGAFFIPFASFASNGPFFEQNKSYAVIDVYNTVSTMDFDGLITMLSSTVLGKTALFLAISLVCIILSAVFALLQLILSFLSCSPHGYSRNMTLDILGIVTDIAAIVCYNQFISALNTAVGTNASASVQTGAYVIIATFVLSIIINVIIKKKGVAVKYKSCIIEGYDSEEYFEKYGHKKVTLDDIEQHLADRRIEFKEEEEKQADKEPATV